MLKNRKLFIPPPNDGSDFKELFKRLAAAGAGRPLGSDGFPAGPWTPELLALAISQIDSNRVGVDLRTVQLWFQENEKGISTANIRWLARIFGCDDPVATSEWQMQLSEAQSRFTAKRRESKNARSSASAAPEVPEVAWTASGDDVTRAPAELARETDIKRPDRRPGLALRSEALFSHGSPLNLPASVFAGATALGFLSYITGIHSATYIRADGVVKQVGFLWAPNWTFLFMVLLPLFFSLVTELLVFWKGEGRLKLLAQGGQMESDHDWGRNVEASSYSYWAVFLICVLFAGVFQWIGVCLIPLMKGGADYATSWGSLAVVRPEIISVPMSIVFTALAYLYMCLCFYLFFVGLILLHTMVHDLWRLEEASKSRPEAEYRRELNQLGLRLMRGIFRCTVLGVLVAVCMKAQSAYLTSNREDIVAWFVGDISSALHHHADVSNRFSYRMPTHYSSLLVAVSACVVFLYGSIRLGGGSRFQLPLWKMSAVVALLFVSYLLIDAFAGFSILLGIGVLLGIYGLCDPGFGASRTSEIGNQSVS
ncbi:RcgA family putative transporter [Rhizobium rhizogenes]|uniref:Transmembrane protein n=1 Tax=Rhizobium rhizogenes NBRC 13257 TaxID=1220581 RepID=A0AA87U6X4_RHIRH|nr:hypothetical protein [Rhizobium rhizogenes]NTG71525.1 hypothetical protein [Rhizobium rhizogenes]NTG90620.1 hypothetical protein [Rhizobium rhizogenes]TRB03439.1 hypothetical protein EXN67_29440 [Rhizobium rhizogenes]TRB38181.1 hypothetical protein EXN73_29005 [Rhizobium rhizogenes]TRB53192.1 hypothetical protein EXN71_28990 [Rhizobium rhizogenes]